MSQGSNESGGGRPLSGVIVLSGPFVTRHRAELLDLVRTTECASLLSDQALQIERITEEADRLIIETTTSDLAERIGERLCAVCGGAVTKDSTEPQDGRCRFVWSRLDGSIASAAK